MHQATLLGHGYEYVDSKRNVIRHSDYRFELISKKLFTESERDKGGKFIILL